MATTVAPAPRTPALPPTNAAPRSSASERWNWQVDLPAWLASMLFHLAALLALGLGATATRGTGAPMTSLVASTSDGDADDLFDDERDAPVQISPAASATTGGGEQSGGLAAAIGDTAPIGSENALPAPDASAPGGGTGPGEALGPAGFTDGAGPSRPIAGSKARTKLYGIEAEGEKFVYVFDRSDSMNAFSGRPLRSAKRQLIDSLQGLRDVHQFQIVFYNEEPSVMQLANRPGGLVFANDQTRRLAERYIQGVLATGGTNHHDALLKALALGPDVIFFLTDADQPGMQSQQLQRIRQANGGKCSINTIEFGQGESPRANNFLQRLAKENDGQYVYIDMTRRGALEAP